MKKSYLTLIFATALLTACSTKVTNESKMAKMELTQEWDKVFQLSEK